MSMYGLLSSYYPYIQTKLYIGKLRSNVSGSVFRFVPAHSGAPEMTVSYCPRIFRSSSSLGPCRKVDVRLGLGSDTRQPDNGDWNILANTLDFVDLESVPPEKLDSNTCGLHFPLSLSSHVVPSVKNFQLRESFSKRIVFSFHKVGHNTFSVLWAPDVISRPVWAMCLGISSVEYKICTQ